MPYRKFKADYIFTGTELLHSNNVLITDETGLIKTIIEEKDAGDNIEVFKGLISPGFVNCHCHLELSHMKNVIESGTGLVDFLIKVISKRGLAKEEMEAAIQAADKEMFDNGIVAVGDISNTTNSLKTKLQSKIHYHNFIEVLGFSEEKAKIVLESYMSVYREFCNSGFYEHTSVIPHAPYTISGAMFGLINNLSDGKIVSIHNQESIAENELYKTKTGDFLKLYNHLNINTDFFQPYNKSSLQAYLPLLNKPKQLLLIHNTYTGQPDIDFAFEQSNKSNQQLFWCLCPNANLYIENRLPPAELLKQNNCCIVLGTDSYSSNWSLNILDEIKTLQRGFSSLKFEELLQWATLNGAKALKMQDTFGSFEKGKQPGIILINNIHQEKTDNNTVVKRLCKKFISLFKPYFMKKYFFYFACVFISSNKINAQAFIKLAGGSGGDVANCIAQTTDSGLVMAGDTYSFGLSKSDILITKFDGSGNLLWNRRYGSSDYDHAYCITATTDGGCAVAGVTGGNHNNLVVIKLDAAGNLEWSKLYNASARNGAHSIKQTPEGGFVIGGYAETYDNGSWGYVLKTDVSGNLEWSKLIFDKGYYPGITSLVVTQDSGYAFVANETTDNAYYDIFLIKLDKQGNFKWAKSVGGSSTDLPVALVETLDGGFAVTGSTIDPGGTPQSKFMYVLRTDKNGNFIFSKRIKGPNSDVANAIIETAGGNFMIGGGVASPSGNFTNPFACKLSPVGVVIWTRTVPSDTISFRATGVITTNTNGLAACGYSGKSGAEDFLISRFDSNFKLCQVVSLKRSTENFGTAVDRTVKVSNATTNVYSSEIALITDNINYASFCTVLPVNLISFTAIPNKNNTALLRWKTAEETNAGSIEIYRSNDGRTFSKLTQLAAQNSANGADYEYVDNSPSAGRNFYKLKFVDKDGEYFFSDIKTVDILKGAIRLFPNPAKDIVTLQMADVPGSIRVQVYTTIGKLVIDEIVSAQNNSITKTFNISRLAAGTYNIRVTSGDTKTLLLFVKQ